MERVFQPGHLGVGTLVSEQGDSILFYFFSRGTMFSSLVLLHFLKPFKYTLCCFKN